MSRARDRSQPQTITMPPALWSELILLLGYGTGRLMADGKPISKGMKAAIDVFMMEMGGYSYFYTDKRDLDRIVDEVRYGNTID